MPVSVRASDPEIVLVERWRAGDERARDILIQRHERLVHGLARRFASWGEPYDDLAQVAWVGFLKCLERFDTERGVALSTYCAPYIIGCDSAAGRTGRRATELNRARRRR